jgi:hypothetical protein
MGLALNTVDDAYAMLQKIGAPHRLICHAKVLGMLCGDGWLF